MTNRVMLAVIFVLSMPTAVFASSMSVRAEPPVFVKLLNQNTAWNIFLEGEIDSGAPARVAEALKKAGSDGADVYINSPGGNLLAGIQIGQLIRKAGANTRIGSIEPDPSEIITGKLGIKYLPGYCMSACSLAFLGGVYRYANEGSKYGVHRFSSGALPETNDLDVAQVISAAVSAYIREMGVDTALFELMVQKGKDDIRILSATELTQLNVVNNGRQKAEWSIEATNGGQYLRGVQDSVYGKSKAVLPCYDGRMYYYSFYQTGPEKAASIAAGEWVHSLFVNDAVIPLPNPIQANADGDEVAVLFSLTREQAMAIASSSSMGHAMQWARDAPTFVGYRIDIPPLASQKVSTFIRNCFQR